MKTKRKATRGSLLIVFALCILIPSLNVSAADQGWTHLETIDRRDYLKVYYRVEGGQLKLKWLNSNPCHPVDIRYQVKWEEKIAGRWEERSSAWKGHVHVNKDSENHTFARVQLDKEDVRNVKLNVIDHKWGERSRARGCE